MLLNRKQSRERGRSKGKFLGTYIILINLINILDIIKLGEYVLYFEREGVNLLVWENEVRIIIAIAVTTIFRTIFLVFSMHIIYLPKM